MNNGKELLHKIQTKLHEEAESYTEIRLIVAKNIFIFIAVLYYSVWLFTVGGWQKEAMSKITYFLFIMLAGSTLWLLACLIEYGIHIYAPKYVKIIYAIWGVIALIFVAIVLMHLNFISF